MKTEWEMSRTGCDKRHTRFAGLIRSFAQPQAQSGRGEIKEGDLGHTPSGVPPPAPLEVGRDHLSRFAPYAFSGPGGRGAGRSQLLATSMCFPS